MAMTTKQCKMTQRQIDFIQKYADKLEVNWCDGLRRILDTVIDNYEKNAGLTENQTKNNLSYSRGGDDLGLVKSPEEELIMKYVSVLQQKWSEDNNE